MRRALGIALALAFLQILLLGLYALVERGRPSRGDGAASPSPERMDETAHALAFRSADGATRRLADLAGRPVLVHFWATWCPPCREELPRLLALADRGVVDVLAVSLDRDWAVVRKFLGQAPPPAVVLAVEPESQRRFGVTALPETFLVDAAGHIRLRFAGARRWDAADVSALIEETRPDR